MDDGEVLLMDPRLVTDWEAQQIGVNHRHREDPSSRKILRLLATRDALMVPLELEHAVGIHPTSRAQCATCALLAQLHGGGP